MSAVLASVACSSSCTFAPPSSVADLDTVVSTAKSVAKLGIDLARAVNRLSPESRAALPYDIVAAAEKFTEALYDDELDNLGASLRQTLLRDSADGLVHEVHSERGHRIDGPYETYSEAEQALTEWQGRPRFKYDNLRIARVPRQAVVYAVARPELIETLAGRIDVVAFGVVDLSNPRENTHVLRDETGRCVSATSTQLVGHPIFERLDSIAQERIWADLQRSRRNHAEIRALNRASRLGRERSTRRVNIRAVLAEAA
jgi:hypothetical protein